MDYITVTKKITSFVIGTGIGTIARSIALNSLAEDASTYRKLCVNAAGVVLGMMVADHAEAYTDKTIDKIIKLFRPDEKPTEETEEVEESEVIEN